ncbi:MAG: type II toxin-antitoxin system VapC family toxin [Burkholderiales bacterium]
MRCLLDTCIISELTRPKPEPGLVRWFSQARSEDLFLSAITIGEVRKGTLQLAPGRRRAALSDWLDDLARRFAGRILLVDEAVAARWAEIAARAERSGKPKPLADGLIAATALQHDLTLATRNVGDFEPFGVSLFNPWVE